MPAPIDTRERILRTALTMANSHGVDAVAIRSLAKELDLSPGNVSYHFPRKADVLAALSEQLSARNEPLGEIVPENLGDLLERYRQALRHQYEHRGLVVALPHLIETYPDIRRRYREVERQRFAQQRDQLVALRQAGRVEVDDEGLERVVALISLVARFWLAEYRTTYYRRAIDEVIGHYLALIAGILSPYATPTGAGELAPYLAARLHLDDT